MNTSTGVLICLAIVVAVVAVTIKVQASIMTGWGHWLPDDWFVDLLVVVPSYWIGAFCTLAPLVAMLVAGAKMFGINLGAPYGPSRGGENDPKP